MEKAYTKRYCLCSGWEAAINDSFQRQKLAGILEYYPDVCPYCHEKLKVKLRDVDVCISLGGELCSDDCSGISSLFISLTEFKQLLEEV